jgi:protein-tyrosine phosphatase
MNHPDRKPFRVLFVCMGNICRSPAAEIVFHHKVTAAGLADAVETNSAGTIGFHAGKGPDPRMASSLAARGYRIFGRSRQIRKQDLDDFDLILVMDRENRANVRKLDPDHSRHEKIRLFMEYGTQHTVTEVPDPYYGGDEGFEHVADLVEDAADGLLRSIQ